MFSRFGSASLVNRFAVKPVSAVPTLSRIALKRPAPSFDSLLLELPQHLDLMAARLQNGENIYSVLTDQARADGKLATALGRLSKRLLLGDTLHHSLDCLASELGSDLVYEWVNKIKLSVERGTPLAGQFQLLSASAKNSLHVAQLKAAGRNELKMLVPLVFLILPVTIAFAVFPSLQLLQLGV